MQAPSVEPLWRALLPPQIRLSAGGEPPSTALSASERHSIEGAGTRRIREFAAGRWHAKRALMALGFDTVDLPRGANGAPQWPAGVVGSLSHAWHGERLVVIAAAARIDEVSAIGVDLEPPGQVEPNAWPTLFPRAQLDAIVALPVAQRGKRVRAVWCAKEAVAKAGGMARSLAEIEVVLDAENRFDFGGHTGRVVQEAGWTFAAAMRFAPDRPGGA